MRCVNPLHQLQSQQCLGRNLSPHRAHRSVGTENISMDIFVLAKMGNGLVGSGGRKISAEIRRNAPDPRHASRLRMIRDIRAIPYSPAAIPVPAGEPPLQVLKGL